MSDLRELLAILAKAPIEVRQRVLDRLSATDRRALAEHWHSQALPGQIEPPGEWRTWLIMAGRGFGKTRTGAEWVLEQARRHAAVRIALVGASLDEVAKVMIEGDSGILRCARAHERIGWRSTTGRLTLPNGGLATAYSGASPDGLRGPQHHFAWADEIAKWAYPEESWANLQLGLRLGRAPRAVATTTPGKGGVLQAIIDHPDTTVTGGRTSDNPYLAEAFVAAMREMYGGTRLGRQELDGVLLKEADGALWTREVIERRRIRPFDRQFGEDLRRIVVGVDPPAGDKGDACGIMVCGSSGDGRVLVLADCSVSGERPDGWARKVAAAVEHWRADRVIVEANNGGQMAESVLRTVSPGMPVRLVHASRGKAARAEPVAAAFEAGKCWFAGFFPELEDELTQFTPAGFTGSGSPDRADAMVWALTELVLRPRPEPRVRAL